MPDSPVLPEEWEPQEDAVAVAYVHSDHASMSWHHSIVKTLAHDLANHLRVIRGGWVPVHCGTGGLVEARNMAVETFLQDRTAPWMLWTDTDMGWEPDALDRLLAVADAKERRVVGGLCFSQRELGPDDYSGYRTASTPTIFDWGEVDGKHGFIVRYNYQPNSLLACKGTGSAFILIHRSVFEEVEAHDGPVWYDRIVNRETGQRISEDLSFCVRLGALNIPVYVHSGIVASHHKGVWISEQYYMDQRMAQAMREHQAKENPAETARRRALAAL
jgi:hypothetical protein